MKQIILFFLVLIFLFLLGCKQVDEIKEIPIHVKVGNYVGIVLSKNLEFGTVFPGGSAFKKFSLNNSDVRREVHFKADFPYRWINYSENDFFLEKYEIKNITVFMNVPKNAAYKDYNGTLYIYFYDVK